METVVSVTKLTGNESLTNRLQHKASAGTICSLATLASSIVQQFNKEYQQKGYERAEYSGN